MFIRLRDAHVIKNDIRNLFTFFELRKTKNPVMIHFSTINEHGKTKITPGHSDTALVCKGLVYLY